MSKERDLLRKILSDTQYINYACNDKIRNEIVEFLAQPETLFAKNDSSSYQKSVEN